MRHSHRTKVERALPRITIILGCLAYLAIALVAISIGLLNVSNFVQPRLERAHFEARALMSNVAQERMLYGQLDKLLSIQLPRRFMETHQECLARGLETANKQLFGIGFQYPDIRNQTMDWTMENCGRLLYTPQSVSDPTLEQAILTGWAQASYRARKLADGAFEYLKKHVNPRTRQLADEALSYVKQNVNHRTRQLAEVWNEWFSADHVPDKSAHVDLVLARDQHQDFHGDHQPHAQMPFGFDLDCDVVNPRVCRLVYLHKPVDMAKISAEAITKSRRKAMELGCFATNLGTVTSAITMSAIAVGLLQVFLVIVHGIASLYLWNGWLFLKMFDHQGSKQDECALDSLFMEVLLIGMYSATKMVPIPGGNLTMVWGLFMSLLGFTVLLSFFVPTSPQESVLGIYDSVNELYRIIRGRDIPSATTERSRTAAQLPRRHSAPAEARPEPASQPQLARPTISPTPAVPEDHHAEPSALCAEQKTEVMSESDEDIQTESDDDSNDGSFVDLAGGVTPQIVDAEADWSIVDA